MPFLSKKSPAIFSATARCSRSPRAWAHALSAVAVAVAGLAGAGCSASSGAPASNLDASADTSTFDGPAPPLGVPVSSCNGCPVCGGVLASPTTGITYCTQDCTADTDCPSGTGCVAALSNAALANECIKKCTTGADCSGGFICRSDLPTVGSFCWSSYPPPADAGPVSEAGTDAGTADSGDAAPAEAGADSGAPPSDAAADALSE
jgi:hypothetical protein